MLSEGTQIGNYEIEAYLGSGGMSAVYRARHRVLNSIHAIKVLDGELGRRRSLRERFLKEGQVLAQVRHPALVRVTDNVDDGGVAGLVMDFLEGRDLGARLVHGAMSVEEAAGVMLQVLSAVGHAHDAGVVHRDLKPANVFLVDRGDHRSALAVVLDFGIAKLRGSELTQGSGTMGTVAYMSPEQLERPADVDARSDLFSLGVVLYEMVAGGTPWPGDTDFSIMKQIVAGEHEPLPEAAVALAPAIHRALQADPSERYSSAVAFARAIRPLAASEVRLMVDEWEGSGAVDTSRRGPSELPAVAAPSGLPARPAAGAAVPAVAVSGGALPLAPSAGGGMADAEVVRLAGIMQLTSGVFNVCVMSVIQCLGIGWIGGLPMCLGGLLLVVGMAEIGSGLIALAFGNPRWIRPTAFLEVISLAGAGLLSASVGVLLLFVCKRYPNALP